VLIEVGSATCAVPAPPPEPRGCEALAVLVMPAFLLVLLRMMF
jgi:hypothetical protein